MLADKYVVPAVALVNLPRAIRERTKYNNFNLISKTDIYTSMFQ